MKQLPAITAFASALLVCAVILPLVALYAAPRTGQSWELALPTPPHFEDYERLQNEFERRGFSCGARVHLGTPHLFVTSADFARPRAIATDFIKRHSLTIRLARDTASGTWEVWERGLKQREESYRITTPKTQ